MSELCKHRNHTVSASHGRITHRVCADCGMDIPTDFDFKKAWEDDLEDANRLPKDHPIFHPDKKPEPERSKHWIDRQPKNMVCESCLNTAKNCKCRVRTMRPRVEGSTANMPPVAVRPDSDRLTTEEYKDVMRMKSQPPLVIRHVVCGKCGWTGAYCKCLRPDRRYRVEGDEATIPVRRDSSGDLEFGDSDETNAQIQAMFWFGSIVAWPMCKVAGLFLGSLVLLRKIFVKKDD